MVKRCGDGTGDECWRRSICHCLAGRPVNDTRRGRFEDAHMVRILDTGHLTSYLIVERAQEDEEDIVITMQQSDLVHVNTQ